MAVGAGGVALSTGSSVVARWFDTHRGRGDRRRRRRHVGGAARRHPARRLADADLRLADAACLWLGRRAAGRSCCRSAPGSIRNTPEERGLRPFGATGTAPTAAQAAAAQQAGRVSVTEAAQTLPFWLLMGTFFVCGYTSVGMIGTHFIPHALEHNFTAMQASAALGVMGAMNIVGTIGSGWLCDRFGRRGAAGDLLLRARACR